MDSERRTGGAGAGIGALANALVRAGVRDAAGRRFSDAMVFAASGGIGFQYVVVGRGRSSRVILDGTARGTSTRTDLVDETAARLGALVASDAFDAELLAENALVGHVRAGDSVVVWVDRASLPYDPLPQGYEGATARLVGVVACDLASEELLLDDRSARPLPVPAVRLRLARSMAPVSRSRMGLLRPGVAVTEFALAAAVLASLGAGANAHAESPLGNRGVTGMRTLAQRMRDPSHPQAWRRLFGRSVGLFQAHVGLYRNIEQGAGPGLGRALLADALDELAARWRRQDLAAQGRVWRSIADRWTTLARVALPDAVPVLREARELLQQRHSRFLQHGLEDSAGLAESSERLSRLTNAIETQFPLDGPGLALLHGELASALDGLAQAEAKAAADLGAVCRAPVEPNLGVPPPPTQDLSRSLRVLVRRAPKP